MPGVEQEQASSLGASNAINGMAKRIRIIEILLQRVLYAQRGSLTDGAGGGQYRIIVMGERDGAQHIANLLDDAVRYGDAKPLSDRSQNHCLENH